MSDTRQYVRTDGSCPFENRFDGLADARAKARIDSTVRKIQRGLRPDVKSVGAGVQEARIDYGPGYRVYFGLDGTEMVILLLCGDKRTQADDISLAKMLWTEYRERKRAGETSWA